MRRTLIVANKSWEVAPLVGVLQSESGRPSAFPDSIPVPQALVPTADGTIKKVSARLAYKGGNGSVEVWCVKDLMDSKANGSSSEEKARVLPFIIGDGPVPDLVVAFGTANSPDKDSFNGCVSIGSRVFIHNTKALDPNPVSQWVNHNFGKIVENDDAAFVAKIIEDLIQKSRYEIESRFIIPPINAAKSQAMIASAAHTAVSNVNITDYDEYAWADREAIESLRHVSPRNICTSVETTHGIIRLTVPSRHFLYVSGIANRLGYFSSEVSPRSYAQNFASSHNAAVVLSWMVPQLV